MTSPPLRIGKNKKYGTSNPIARYLMRNLVRRLGDLLPDVSYETVLEVGCGEGVLLASLRHALQGRFTIGVDVDLEEIEAARRNAPFAKCIVADAYHLPFDDNRFDLVICSEVLEHLGDPDTAVCEIRRVSKRHCLFSVPNEPLWRMLNMARGAYLPSLGDTRGHVNHWNSRSFRRFIAAHLEVVKVVRPLPWVAVLCDKGLR